MAKARTNFICQECGYESSGWLGKCPACNNWNTFIEELQKEGPKGAAVNIKDVKPVSINDIRIDAEERFSTGLKEMDRVLGGGMVKGSLIPVGGDPGIGKSTLFFKFVTV
jgi:DNA repair protein RadA/Sms